MASHNVMVAIIGRHFFSLVNKIIFHKRRMTVFMTNFKKNLWDWVTWMV